MRLILILLSGPLLGLALLGFQPALARVATVSDLAAIYEFEHTDITVDRKGYSKTVYEMMIRIGNEEGRERQSVQLIPFNARASKLKVIAARTINGDKTQDVDLKKNLEFKEIGDFARSFDSQKQASISFPGVKIGSKIYLKYEISVNEVPFENFWSGAIVLNGDRIEEYRLKIDSALPLYTWKNDPTGQLVMTNTSVKGRHVFEAHAKGVLNIVSAEEEQPYFSAEHTPIIEITTLPSWDGYAKGTIPVHEKLLGEPLPPILQKIRDEASKEKTPLAKFERVTALIGAEFRYFGDWRRRKGGYIPRPLAEIADSRYGDCKDLSLAVTAIFRSMGYKADIAWVWRGDAPVWKDEYILPIDSFFNHAISRVEADGQVYWVDATNPVSYVRGLLSDISGRPAFVLDPKHPALTMTPPVTSETALSEVGLKYDLASDRTVHVDGEIRFAGRMAFALTSRSFYTAVDTVNYEIVHSVAQKYKILDYKVGDFPRTSRIVTDVVVPLQYTISDIGLRTSAGLGFTLLRENVITPLLYDIKDRISDIYLENPGISITRIEINGARRVGKANLDCDLKSEWANLSRQVSDSKKGVSIHDRVEVKQIVIPNESLKTPAFAKFQDQVRDCFSDSAVILEQR
jgi:hypothetical protein